MIKSRAHHLLALSALLLAALPAQATILVYTSEASFLAATTNRGVDNFTGLSIVADTASPLVRNAGAYGYTATASFSTFFGAGAVDNPWLSTNNANASITFGDFGNAAQAIGANFFGSNLFGEYEPGSITLTATDLGGTTTRSIIDASTTSFLGFVSSNQILSLSLSAIKPDDGFLWPTVDNLILARRDVQVVPVPEPGSGALLLAGLGVMGALARKRAAASA